MIFLLLGLLFAFGVLALLYHHRSVQKAKAAREIVYLPRHVTFKAHAYSNGSAVDGDWEWPTMEEVRRHRHQLISH